MKSNLNDSNSHSISNSKVNELKDEVKYLLERKRLLNNDIYEYDSHCKNGIDFRYDIINICYNLLGEELQSTSSLIILPYLNNKISQIELISFPQRNIIGNDLIEVYISSICTIKREIRSLLIGTPPRPIETEISAEPQDVLIGETHVIILLFIYLFANLLHFLL